MLPAPAQRALSTLATAFADPALAEALRGRWRAGGRNAAAGRADGKLEGDLATAADQLALALPLLTHMNTAIAALRGLFTGDDPAGEVLFLWCASSVWRRDAQMAPLLKLAFAQAAYHDRVPAVARDRVVEGPLLDALACAPLIGQGEQLGLPANIEARARLEILIWEAGASALEVPSLGPWLWGSHSTFDAMIRGPAHGALRGRVLAARCLEVSARGMPAMTDPELVGRTLQVLQPLLLASGAARVGPRGARARAPDGSARAARGHAPRLGPRRLAAAPAARDDGVRVAPRRAAHVPRAASSWPSSIRRARRPGCCAAVAAATPYLFFERRDLWDRLAARILAGDGGAIAARALARGLATLWRRGARHGEVQRDIEAPLRALREMARSRAREFARRVAPLDRGHRGDRRRRRRRARSARSRARPREPDAPRRAVRRRGGRRARRALRRLARADVPARRAASRSGSGTAAPARRRDQRARGLRARLRAAPLGPAARDAPRGRAARGAESRGDVEDASRAPRRRSSISSKERRQGAGRRSRRRSPARGARDPTRRVRARRVRRGRPTSGPVAGPTAHDTCLWLRKLEGLADGSRELPAPLKGGARARSSGASSTRRAGRRSARSTTCAGSGPFAAWWALVIDRPAMLLQLATALPMMAEGALARCCEQAEALRTAVSLGRWRTEQWGVVGGRGARVAARRGHRAGARARGARARARGVRHGGGAQARPRRDVPRAGARGRSPARRARRPGEGAAPVGPSVQASEEDSLARARDARTRRAWRRSSPARSARESCRCSTCGSRRSARSRRRCSRTRCGRPSAGRRRRLRSRRRRSRSSSTATSW